MIAFIVNHPTLLAAVLIALPAACVAAWVFRRRLVVWLVWALVAMATARCRVHAAVRPHVDAFVVAVTLHRLARPVRTVPKHRAPGRPRLLAPRHDHHAASNVAITNSRLEPQS